MAGMAYALRLAWVAAVRALFVTAVVVLLASCQGASEQVAGGTGGGATGADEAGGGGGGTGPQEPRFVNPTAGEAEVAEAGAAGAGSEELAGPIEPQFFTLLEDGDCPAVLERSDAIIDEGADEPTLAVAHLYRGLARLCLEGDVGSAVADLEVAGGMSGQLPQRGRLLLESVDMSALPSGRGGILDLMSGMDGLQLPSGTQPTAGGEVAPTTPTAAPSDPEPEVLTTATP